MFKETEELLNGLFGVIEEETPSGELLTEVHEYLSLIILPNPSVDLQLAADLGNIRRRIGREKLEQWRANLTDAGAFLQVGQLEQAASLLKTMAEELKAATPGPDDSQTFSTEG